MALPNIGNPGGPPKKGDGDLVNNSEGCPTPGEKEWTLDFKFHKFSVGGVPTASPYGGPFDLEIPPNDPRFQTKEHDNPVGQRVQDAAKDAAITVGTFVADTAQGISDSGELGNLSNVESNLARAFLGVANHPFMREGLDNLEQKLEEGAEDAWNGFAGKFGGEMTADVNFGRFGTFAIGTFRFKQPIFMKSLHHNPEGGSFFKCNNVFLRGSANCYWVIDGNFDFKAAAEAGLQAGFVIDAGGIRVDVFGEATVSHTGDWSSGFGWEVHLDSLFDLLF